LKINFVKNALKTKTFYQNPPTKNFGEKNYSIDSEHDFSVFLWKLVAGLFTYQSCWNQSEQVPFFWQVHSVGQEYENTLSNNFGDDEKEHAKFTAESIAPGTEVKCKENGEK
jgi:hypothetical protein